jgi:RNA polymerase sigma-70 factor (ECF subfamily)
VLKIYLLGEKGGPSYAELATRFGTTEIAIKSAVHRLRQRLKTLFREEIARTVASEAEIDDELRHLIRIMAS